MRTATIPTGFKLQKEPGYLGHLFTGAFRVLPCAGGTLADPGNLQLLDGNGDARVDLTDAIYLLNYLFLSGSPPALGTACLRMAGCPDACPP